MKVVCYKEEAGISKTEQREKESKLNISLVTEPKEQKKNFPNRETVVANQIISMDPFQEVQVLNNGITKY